MTPAIPSTRAIAKIFFTVAALVGAVYLAYLIRHTIGLVAISIFLAVALGPAVALLSRRGVPRSLSILIVYMLIAAVIFGVGLLVIPPVVNQVDGLSREIPTYLSDLR